MQLNPDALQLSSTGICGEALMVFRLELEDLNVENNFVVIPVFVDCWSEYDFSRKTAESPILSLINSYPRVYRHKCWNLWRGS